MKNKYRYFGLFLLLSVVMFSSCSKNFQEINTPSDFISSPTLKFELPDLELTMIDNQYNFFCKVDYVAAYVMQVTRRNDFRDIVKPDDEMGWHFKWAYQSPLKTAADMIAHATDPDDVNYLSMARILRVYVMNELTDTYGDVPDSEANEGYTKRIFTPNFESQKVIYENMFNELQEAIQGFDSTKTNPGSADIVYHGNLTKWKQFAYSEMLRLGLRIMNVDPTDGKKWIQTAINGGVMTSNDDNFVVYYLPNASVGSPSNPTSNSMANIWVDYNAYFVTSSLVNFLKDHSDPRLSVYCQRDSDGDTAVSALVGYPPFGYVPIDKNTFAITNLQTFGRYDAPFIHLSYAQVELELAECVVRGIISGDAETYYDNGVQAAMQELAVYGPEGVIPQARINTYLQMNPYNPVTQAQALDMINTQYWVETYYNWYECFANMRRSGYPDFYDSLDMTIPGNFGAALPGRLCYPVIEVAGNPNVQEAIKDQGPDLTTTKVWWDK